MIRRAALGVWIRAALGLAVGLVVPRVGNAQTARPDRPRRLDVPSPQQIFEQFGLDRRRTCIPFREWQRLRVRKERWLDALHRLASAHPHIVYGWIIGARRPPERAVRAATRQRNCLLDALLEEAVDPNTPLQLEVAERPRAQSWLETYFQSDARKRHIRRALTVSHYRSALSQARIWRRKYLFVGGSFNHITAEAAEQCRLVEGTSWKPSRPHHAYCWNNILSGSQREREILSASSAPGLSRHHWGTEFDLFSLAPGDFRPGRSRHDEYRWMRRNAHGFGFFQSYRPHSAIYMAERWHWSYYPIAQALTEFASNHRDLVEDHLDRQWNRFEHRFNGDAAAPVDYFEHIRNHWSSYMFDVFVPNFEGHRRARHEPFD